MNQLNRAPRSKLRKKQTELVVEIMKQMKRVLSTESMKTQTESRIDAQAFPSPSDALSDPQGKASHIPPSSAAPAPSSTSTSSADPSPVHPSQPLTNPYVRRSKSLTQNYPDEISMSTQELDLNVSCLVGETNDGVSHFLTMRELRRAFDEGPMRNIRFVPVPGEK